MAKKINKSIVIILTILAVVILISQSNLFQGAIGKIISDEEFLDYPGLIIDGKIIDKNNNPIQGVLVTFDFINQDYEKQIINQKLSDVNGNYVLPMLVNPNTGMISGELSFEKEGYQSFYNLINFRGGKRTINLVMFTK